MLIESISDFRNQTQSLRFATWPNRDAMNGKRALMRLLTAVAFLALLTSSILAQDKPRACRSVHLWWQNDSGQSPEGTAFYNELTVEASTSGSYFMACGFSKGYFGIQELGNGKKVALFSIWEPGKQNNPNATAEELRVKEIASGKDVRVKRFGGEGTGGQSVYDYDWKIGESVRFVVYARSDGETRTQYAGYIYIPQESRWQHLATFSTLANGHLLRGYYSFVEDFRRNGKSAEIVHRANCGNGWILANTDDGQRWMPLTKGRFTADNTPTSNIDSGAVGDRIFMQTGGNTKNDNTKLRETSSLETADRKPPLDLPNAFADEAELSSKRVRILAYNIKHGRGNDNEVDLERTAAVIRRLNPDVVALQEVDNQCERSGNVDEAKQLAELTGLRHHAFGSFFDFQGGEYGMAIISRYPLSETENLRLPDGAEPRTSLIATVDAPKRFRLAGVHFYATEEQRLAQSRKLLETLDAKPNMATVIAGDFNSLPDSPVLKLFSEWKVPSKGDDPMTFSSDKPNREIDFVMFRPSEAFEVREIDVIHEPVASDHRPLTLDLQR